MQLQICRQKIRLLPEKGLLWPAKKLLAVADLHLGKATAFRSAGIPIPEGDMQKDLARLQKILEENKVERCIIVGDLLHHRTGMTPPIVEMIERWMTRLPCELELVLGNHDVALKSIPHGQWKMTIHQNLLYEDPFCFSHHPTAAEGAQYTWCGHLHPQALIKMGTKGIRVPCFYLQQQWGILPAFSSFAGGMTVAGQPGEEIYGIVGHEVLPITNLVLHRS